MKLQSLKFYLLSAIRCNDYFLISDIEKRCFEGRKGIFVILTITLIVIIKPLHEGNPIGSSKSKDYIKEGFHFCKSIACKHEWQKVSNTVKYKPTRQKISHVIILIIALLDVNCKQLLEVYTNVPKPLSSPKHTVVKICRGGWTKAVKCISKLSPNIQIVICYLWINVKEIHTGNIFLWIFYRNNNKRRNASHQT